MTPLAIAGLALLLFLLWISNHPTRIDAMLEDFARGGVVPSAAELKSDFCPPQIHPAVIKALAVDESDNDVIFRSIHRNLPKFIRERIDLPLSSHERRSSAAKLLEAALVNEGAAKAIALLHDPDLRVRHQACLSLYYGIEGRQSWPSEQLAAEVGNSDPIVRDFVVFALMKIGAKGSSSEPQLIKFFKHEDEELALEATLVTLRMSGDTDLVVSSLERLLEAKSPEVRLEAALKLKNLGYNSPKTRNVLLELVQIASFPHRHRGLDGLSMYGTNAIELLPEIKRFYRDKDIGVRQSATNAVALIDPAANSMGARDFLEIHFYSFRFERLGINQIIYE